MRRLSGLRIDTRDRGVKTKRESDIDESGAHAAYPRSIKSCANRVASQTNGVNGGEITRPGRAKPS